MSKKRLLCVAGPTASGKTALAVEIARRAGAEIISCDSKQVYKYMQIGTAAPTAEERRGVTHHLVGAIEPSETYSAARFAADAGAVIEKSRKPIIVCGGTGLYLKALLEGLHQIPENPQIRAELSGREDNYERLIKVDPQTKIHPNDKIRAARALEVYLATGRTLSEWHKLPRGESPYDARVLLLSPEREELYARINARVDEMIAAGLEREARELQTHNPSRVCAGAIGYREWFAGGDPAEAIKKATRNYAKRQITWWNAEENALRAKKNILNFSEHIEFLCKV